MMPVHSNNILSIQFIRLFERIEHLTRARYSIDEDLRLDSKTRKQEVSVKIHQWVKRTKQEVKKRREILKISDDVLRQIELHNETVKHILDKAISCIVPVIGLAIVFFLGEQSNLFCHILSEPLSLGALMFYASLLKSSDIYTLSRRLSSNLRSVLVRQEGKSIKSQL